VFENSIGQDFGIKLTDFVKRKGFVLSLLILSPVFLLAYFVTIPAEDSVILYEYAKNLAETGVITFGNAGTPIEGATDFLWMLAIAFLKLLGINEFFSALLLNLIGAAFLVNISRAVEYKVAALIGLFLTPYIYSSLNGFSAIFFSALYVYCLSLAINNKESLYSFVLVLCLVRPDGVVWGAGLILLRVSEQWRTLRLRNELK